MQLKHIALVLISGAVFSGCSLLPGKNQEPPSEKNMQAPAVEETQVMPEKTDEAMESSTPDAMMEEGKMVKIVADDFKYDVKEIKVKKGEKLTVSVMNSKGFHDFVIDELAVNSGMLEVGNTMELEIPTDKPGTYEYYCSVGQHRQMGMKGTLIIE